MAGEPPVSNSNGVIKFVVEPGRTILVKGDFLIESDAIIDIQGILVVEGSMVTSKSLDLIISGEGKLLINGGFKNLSTVHKNISVLDKGELSIGGTFKPNENIEIITGGLGVIKANKVFAGDRIRISGTRNLIAPDCNCEQVLKKGESNLCQILAESKT
jgi:hypothetical protein